MLTRWTVPTPPVDAGWYLSVLSSSSGGNCTLLRVHDGHRFRHILIDLGLSPRRTREMMSLFGLALKDVDAALLTHMDQDHLHPGWLAPQGKASPLREDAAMLVHEAHFHAARGASLHRPNLRALAGANEARHLFSDLPAPACGLPAGLIVSAVLGAHDKEGAASFRLTMPTGASLGFATDIGRVTKELVDLCAGVDVLAIESNYCPQMQAASSRPEFLKRRIMGGAGHLSNQETIAAVRAIEPKRHVVLLHLSRQCNTPELVAGLHEGSPYHCTISEPDRPCRWVRIDG